IKQLLLRQNGLTTLEAYGKAFLAMRHYLRELSLKENRLEKVPPEILPLASLTSLSLASNQISSIEEDVLSRLKHLQWLSLSCNELVTLPNDLVDCRKLKGLDIHSNNFQVMPCVIQGLRNLQILLTQKNQLKDIASDFIFPDSLHTLNLSFNEIEHIPYALINNPPERLTHLYLSGNPLRRIPSNFLSVGYNHLVSLDLHTCHIVSISGDFFMRLGVRKLRRLNLAINVLEELPPEIGHLTHIEWLNLNDNRLKHLPVTFSNLTRLVKLGLVQNRLTYLPPRLFSRMYRLQKLDIRRNNLRYLPASILIMSPLSDVISNSEIAVPMAAFQMHPCPPSC
ncbi:L domain-like protein, partial [Lichtheimia hyalospora FSU 10163]